MTPLLAELQAQYPAGATVSYKDLTLRTRRKAITGTVSDVWETATGTQVVTVDHPGGTIETIPENLALLRMPYSKPTPHDERNDEQ